MTFQINTTTKNDNGTFDIEHTTADTLKKAKAIAYEECQWESTIKSIILNSEGEEIEEFRGFFA